MATRFSEAPSEVYSLMGAVIEEYFPLFRQLEVEPVIDVQMVRNCRSAPLKIRGHAVSAMIKIVKGEERANQGPDLRLQIDEVLWAGLDETERKALLHHELQHIVPRRDKKGGHLLLDEYDRPLIRLRPDDWMLSGFEETARIFGGSSLERQALANVTERLRQLNLPFVAANAEAVPSPTRRPRKAKAAEAGV